MRTALFVFFAAAVAAGCGAGAVLLLLPKDASQDWQMLTAVGSPAGVTWSLMAAWVVRSARRGSNKAKELGAQLMRREIELGRTSTVDELTGLATRREFDAMVRLEVGRFQRHRHPTSLLMVEIDNIGAISEAVGSLTSGLVIAELASILKQSLRAIDLGCRFTESSLAILLLETTAAEARSVTDRVREAVAAQTFLAHRRDGNYELTVSQGVATLDASITSHLDFLRAAERALADARAAGADQVRIPSAA